MTSIAKFLLTGLGGLGIITATGYGVYYDANNKKFEKSKKDEETNSNVVEQKVDDKNSQSESKVSVSNDQSSETSSVSNKFSGFKDAYMGVVENGAIVNLWDMDRK